MSSENLDELEPRNGTIPPLPPTATHDDLVEAFNNLAAAVRALVRTDRTHSLELEGIRLAIQEHGTRIESFCQRMEAATARNGTQRE